MKASLFSYVISAALSFATIATASKPVENDTISSKKAEISERNVMLNASDANKPREIQIGLPSEDVNVYENGLPAVYSSAVHKLATHWRSDASLGEVGLMTPSESAIATGNIAYSVNSFSKLGQKEFKGVLNYRTNHFGCPVASETAGSIQPASIRTSIRVVSLLSLKTLVTVPNFIMQG